MPIARQLRTDDNGIAIRNDAGIRVYDYVVRCSSCGDSARVDSPYSRDALNLVTGRPVSDHFRWHSSGGRWVSRCRSCERAARAAGPRSARRAAPAAAVARVLNADRKFGVELECIMPRGYSRAMIVRALDAAFITGWTVKSDGSLRGNGVEVVSPPLSGDEGLTQVARVCRVLKDAGCSVNNSCGTHVHHEIRDLDLDSIKRFARTWANNQNLIDGLVSPSRRGVNRPTYCNSLTTMDAATIENVVSTDQLSYAIHNRYKTVNFQAYGRFGTVEVRQHQGTLDAEKIRTWVKFAQAMIATSAAAPRPVTAQHTVAGFLSTMRDALDATARTFLLGRAVEFAAVPVV